MKNINLWQWYKLLIKRKLSSIIRTAEYVGSLSDKEKAYRLGYVKARSEASKARHAYFKKHCIK